MKIAVLEREGRVSAQCEDSPQVAIVDVEPGSNTVRNITFLTPPPQSVGVLAGWLHEREVEVVLTSGIRQRDCDWLEDQGIQIIVGVPPFRVEAVVANFLAGTLQTGGNLCELETGGCK